MERVSEMVIQTLTEHLTGVLPFEPPSFPSWNTGTIPVLSGPEVPNPWFLFRIVAQKGVTTVDADPSV